MPSVNAGYELSSQQKLFFAQGKESATAGISLRLEGKADAGKIYQTIQTLVQRHEILRTGFQRRTGMKFPFQVVNESATFMWETADLSGMASDQQQSRVAEFFDGGAKLDIEKCLVLHARLIKFAADSHLLLLTFSVLCVDDASLNRLFAEFSALCAGESLPQDVLQYADYSEWQSECLSSQDEDAGCAADFWHKSEFESLPSLSLPFEHKRALGEWSGESIPLPLSLRDVPEAPMFLFAAWQVFLERISGRQDFVLGYVSDGRNHAEFSEGIGLFERTLPLRVNLERDLSFGEFQQEASARLTPALDYQDYLAVDRIAGHVPVGFECYELPQKIQVGNLTISEVQRFVPAAAFRLHLRCSVNVDFVEAALAYDGAHFQQDVVVQLAERFAILVNAAQADPASPTAALPIMGDAELRKVQVEFNRTAADYPRDKCIHQLFESQVTQHPERPALRCGERLLTYVELNRQANRIAHLLRKNGVGANIPVALCVERSLEMITGLLGILKAGGCYVPLVPDSPKARLARQLDETRAPVLLTQQKYLHVLPEFGGTTLCLDRDAELLANSPDSNPAVGVSPQDLVYVIYTSGSTGTPKGVAVRHFNLVNYSHFICRWLALEQHPEGLNFATVSTISADLGNTCVFPSLISGGCLHVIDYETAMAPALIAEYALRHPFDVLKITPSHLSSLLNNDGSTLPRKALILGGEAARWDLVERVRKTGTCAVLNHYGPTEATVGCCTFNPQTSDVSAWEPATMPIGRSIANDEIYIVDRRMQSVPIGVAGELCIGGVGLAQGYLNQPQQTAERFVRNPFSRDPDARLYRTGDLARFLPDGNIEFLGRIDAQVKIRGFRVEPAEIESVLKRHAAVEQAAVVSYDSEAGEKRLAAFVVARSQVRTEDFRAFLLQELPEYMVPSAFVPIDSSAPDSQRQTRRACAALAGAAGTGEPGRGSAQFRGRKTGADLAGNSAARARRCDRQFLRTRRAFPAGNADHLAHSE